MMEWSMGEWLRILCGLWFLPHMCAKALNFSKAAATFVAAGMSPGGFFVALALVMEGLAAIGLVLGIYPRLAALLAILVLLGASYAVLKINGFNWRWQRMGPEFPLFWAAMCALSALAPSLG